MKRLTAAPPYEHPREHVEDELQLLDLRIEAGLRAMTSPPEDPALDPFRGLVVTESEVQHLLTDSGRYTDMGEERLRELQLLEGHTARRVASTAAEGETLPLLRLQSAFGLDERDLRMLVAILAPDLDRKYEKLYAYLQDDMTSRFATADLLLRLCCASERERRRLPERLQPPSPLHDLLRHEPYREDGGPRSALARPLRADERIVSYAQGYEWAYTGAVSGLRRYRREEPPDAPERGDALQERLRRHIRETADHAGPVVYMLHGPTGSGKTMQSRLAAAAVGRELLEWDVSAAPADEQAFREAAGFVLREARLLDAVPAIAGWQAVTAAEQPHGRAAAMLELLAEWCGPVFLHAETPWAPARPLANAVWIDIALGLPSLAERHALWLRAAGPDFALSEAEAAALAAKFRFTPGLIERTVRTAVRMRRWEQGKAAAHPPYEARLLHRAGYLQVKHRLSEKAVKLEPKFGWEDLILPDEPKSLLRQACKRLLLRHVVFGEWGFERKLAYGKGLSMLFTGPPGTGKTMSAMVMAREMDAELYRVDLSRVVSKYIGETEKHLSGIFDEAQLSGAILFFDEADALFGKRSEVKDAHDKYANMETSYLLQKMEEYEGLTILATNFSQNLDEAFTRRIQFIVKFPFPDPAQREQLWRSTFPEERADEQGVDFGYLARTFDLSGGSIKNVVLTAAFLAADEGVRIGMKHMIEAVKQEYKKTGKVLLKDRLGAYADV